MAFPVLVIGLLGLVVIAQSVMALRRDRAISPLQTMLLALLVAVSQLGPSYVGALLLGGAAATVTQVLVLGLVLAMCIVRTSEEVQENSSRNRGISPASLILAVVVVMFVVNLVSVSDRGFGELLVRILAVAAAAGLVYLTRSQSIAMPVLSAATALAFGLSALSSWISPEPTRACSQFKCGPFGFQVRGPFDNENAFGFLAVVAILLIFNSADRRLRYSVWILGAFVLYATESRTSQISVACGLVVIIVWRFFPRDLVRLARAVLVLLPTAIAALGMHLVYSASPSEFSNRGIIWSFGRMALGDQWLLGRGLDSWSIDALDRSYMHSQYFLFVYSAGVFSLLLFVGALTFALAEVSSRREDGANVAVIVAVLVMGVTELVWNPLGIERGMLVGIALLAIFYELRRRREGLENPHSEVVERGDRRTRPSDNRGANR